jgi:hypothetical protein
MQAACALQIAICWRALVLPPSKMMMSAPSFPAKHRSQTQTRSPTHGPPAATALDGPHDVLDGAMVLLNDTVVMLDLARFDVGPVSLFVRLDRSLIGATLVYRDRP